MKKTYQKVQSKAWEKNVDTALNVTGSILSGLGNAGVPIVGLVGSALTMGAEILNPAPKLKDLKEETKTIEEAMENQTDVVRSELEMQLTVVQGKIQKENNDHFNKIQKQVQMEFNEMSSELKEIESKITEMNDVIHKTYSLTMDLRYKEGIENVESAHKILMDGSHNLEGTLPILENYIFELQTSAHRSLKPRMVEKYLKALLESEGIEAAILVFNYIMIVKAKYLQLATIFYIFKKDDIRVETEFGSFNLDYRELEEIYQNLFQQDFDPQYCPKINQSAIPKVQGK